MRRRRKGCKAWTQLKLQVVRSDPEFVTTTAGPAFNFSRPNVDEAQVARITSFALEALSKSINAPGAISGRSCPKGDSPRERLLLKSSAECPKYTTTEFGSRSDFLKSSVPVSAFFLKSRGTPALSKRSDGGSLACSGVVGSVEPRR